MVGAGKDDGIGVAVQHAVGVAGAGDQLFDGAVDLAATAGFVVSVCSDQIDGLRQVVAALGDRDGGRVEQVAIADAAASDLDAVARGRFVGGSTGDRQRGGGGERCLDAARRHRLSPCVNIPPDVGCRVVQVGVDVKRQGGHLALGIPMRRWPGSRRKVYLEMADRLAEQVTPSPVTLHSHGLPQRPEEVEAAPGVLAALPELVFGAALRAGEHELASAPEGEVQAYGGFVHHAFDVATAQFEFRMAEAALQQLVVAHGAGANAGQQVPLLDPAIVISDAFRVPLGGVALRVDVAEHAPEVLRLDVATPFADDAAAGTGVVADGNVAGGSGVDDGRLGWDLSVPGTLIHRGRLAAVGDLVVPAQRVVGRFPPA